MQYLGARGKICLLGVRIVCMSATPCLSVHRCDMALFKYNLVGWSGKRQKTSSSPHVNANLFLPWSSWGFGLWCLNATFLTPSKQILPLAPKYCIFFAEAMHIICKFYGITRPSIEFTIYWSEHSDNYTKGAVKRIQDSLWYICLAYQRI
jgi:hypothetical protein